MTTNIEKYKKDLNSLIKKGEDLHGAIRHECFPKQFTQQLTVKLGEKAEEYINQLPSFRNDYQTWYSEAKSVIKQLLPDRLADFVRYYEKPKLRKFITNENYRIEDYLQGLSLSTRYPIEQIVGPEAAIPHFIQQLAIIRAITVRFESSLFDIRQLVQADLFDTELDSAKELAKHMFLRAAGAIAGVVLEKHLAQVCDNHGIKISKRDPSISDFNDSIKKESVIDVPTWRNIQLLGDLRNLCDHNKEKEPTPQQVEDLIDGVIKITKTVF